MSDYIKKEDAIQSIIAHDLVGGNARGWAKYLLEYTSTADVAPVRHGRWVETSYDEYKCSACGKVVREEILYAIKPSDREDASMHVANYCPNCGAKMDEEE